VRVARAGWLPATATAHPSNDAGDIPLPFTWEITRTAAKVPGSTERRQQFLAAGNPGDSAVAQDLTLEIEKWQ